MAAGIWPLVWGDGGERAPGRRIEERAYYSGLRQELGIRQRANSSDCFRLDWRKGSRHIHGIVHGTSTALHGGATWSPVHSAPSLPISAASLPQNAGIFSRDSTLCPWSIAELEAKSPVPSKSYPFFSGQRMSYCRAYFQASF